MGRLGLSKLLVGEGEVIMSNGGFSRRGPSYFVRLPDQSVAMITGRDRDTGHWRVLPGFEHAGRPARSVPDSDCSTVRRTYDKLVEYWESLPETLVGSAMYAAIRQHPYTDYDRVNFIGHLAFGHSWARDYEPGLAPAEPRTCGRCKREGRPGGI